MTRNEKINKFLYELKNDNFIFEVEEANYMDEFLEELKEVGLVYRKGDFLRVTKEGIMLTNAGKTYEDFLQPKPEQSPSFHIGHNIIGDVSHSNLSNRYENNTNASFLNSTTKATTTNKKEGRPILEIASWIAGIVSMIIALYLYFSFVSIF